MKGGGEEVAEFFKFSGTQIVEIAEQMENMYLKPRLNLNSVLPGFCVSVSLCVYTSVCMSVCLYVQVIILDFCLLTSRMMLVDFTIIYIHINDICTIKTGLIIMQITGLNFYRNPGIHGFCTWNEKREHLS